MNPHYKKIVVKIGTNVITRDDGSLHVSVLKRIVDQIAQLRAQKVQVIVVSSGAMAAGRAIIHAPKPKTKDVVQRQVLAAVGQVHLIHAYSQFFQEHKTVCAQVLATKEDFKDRHHYLNMKNCFDALLKDGIVPVVNENDAVAVSELMFTDNDELAGLVAAMMNVDALIILTNVEGIMTREPGSPDAVLVPRVLACDTVEEMAVVSPKKSPFGRGGMATKCRVASRLAKMGIAVHIGHGETRDILLKMVRGEETGTVFEPARAVSGTKKWLAHARGQEKGVVFINEHAEELFLKEGIARSLLPVGVAGIDGSFVKGDIVKIKGASGRDLGCGVAQYSSDMAREYIGQSGKRALIHYDYLYLDV